MYRRARATYEHAIAPLIGKPAAKFALGVAPFIPKPPTVPVTVPSTAGTGARHCRSERQVAAANAQIGIARAPYYPSLILNASGGIQTSQFSQ